MFDSFSGCFNTVNGRIVLCFFLDLFVDLPQVVNATPVAKRCTDLYLSINQLDCA